ncbi:hypothetical protein CU044_7565 [Streptomyces sp. L-9-10]|nr:hypothetical protein CU044_7565 [Streptomyces sp. L-9-10]
MTRAAFSSLSNTVSGKPLQAPATQGSKTTSTSSGRAWTTRTARTTRSSSPCTGSARRSGSTRGKQGLAKDLSGDLEVTAEDAAVREPTGEARATWGGAEPLD